MEELMTLKNYLLAGDITAALTLVDEMEEMSKDDKISTIASYAVILLLHLIKQQIEQHTTKSWDVSIRNCVRQINRKNKRRKAGGYYLTKEELLNILQEVFNDAIDQASLEVADGKYDYEQLSALVDKNLIIDQAMNLINHAQSL
ncbi:DUF29 family protein [Synechococcus sp. C9]|uniref:DUF29 family protein n=1 Tax=Synechococcus sp. C9 TaxID=102119 RepID=UPI001FF22992|nr:DUF29 family protein [Synechococcus sp. C9]